MKAQVECTNTKNSFLAEELKKFKDSQNKNDQSEQNLTSQLRSKENELSLLQQKNEQNH